MLVTTAADLGSSDCVILAPIPNAKTIGRTAKNPSNLLPAELP